MAEKLLTTKEAIARRRSIRSYKSDPVDEATIMELLEAAQLAPSGCNSQPWRFKVITDAETKAKLQEYSFNQKFVSQAPVVLVVCADVQGYLDGRVSGVQDLGSIGVFDDDLCEILHKKTKQKSKVQLETLRHSVAFNCAIAMEHIVLRALDYGLGTCWMKLIDEKAIRELFGWEENLYPCGLIPIGFPAENPAPRKRRPVKDFLIE